MRTVLLLLLLTIFGAYALPNCSWACTGLVPTSCDANCRGVCAAYNCSVTSCTGSNYWSTYCPTIHPVCRTICPTATGTLTDSCPVCTDSCNPLPNECIANSCVVTCQTPVCTWTCTNPTNCALPTCTLTCEDPACETVALGTFLKPALGVLLALMLISILG